MCMKMLPTGYYCLSDVRLIIFYLYYFFYIKITMHFLGVQV